MNQQNQAVITQLQQQFLQGAKQQLPTHKEIGDLQHHLERLEADYQKHISQLHEDLRNHESQHTQLRNELTSVRQTLQSIPRVDIDLLQDRIHNLQAHFEIKFRTLEENFNQSSIDQLENRISRLEQTIAELSKTAFIKNIFDSYSQDLEKQLENLSVFKSSFPDSFDPVVLGRDVRVLLNRTKELEDKLQEYNVELKTILAEATVTNHVTAHSDGLLSFDFVQSEVDELDRRNKNLFNEVELLKENISSHSKSVSHRIQKNQIEVKAWLSQLEKEIQKIRYDVNRVSSISKKDNLEKKSQDDEPICYRCGKVCESVIKGKVLDYVFCSRGCSDLYQRLIETEGH